MLVSKLVCDKCGTVNEKDAKYCKECGTKGYEDSIKIPDTLSPTAVKCKHCGAIKPSVLSRCLKCNDDFGQAIRYAWNTSS